MLVTASFLTAKKWEQPESPSAGEWTNPHNGILSSSKSTDLGWKPVTEDYLLKPNVA